jgi:dCTP deaminase
MQVCLCDKQIRDLIASDVVIAPNKDTSKVQPASLDTSVGDTVYQIMASALPCPGKSVLDTIDDYHIASSYAMGTKTLQVGCTYVVRLQEELALPDNIMALANPKSSIGRLGVHVRLLIDGCERFDFVPAGYKGPLYIEITPLVFPIEIQIEDSFMQLRFICTDKISSLPHLPPRLLRVDLHLDKACYRAKGCAGVIDINDTNFYNPSSFWERVHIYDDRLILEPGRFYLLASQQIISVPENYAAELAPYDHTLGEYRAHYAGFCDPGFCGRIVMEVCVHKTPFVITHGQTLATLQYIAMAEKPDATYGPKIGSHYQDQGLKLSKHFLLAEGCEAV